MSRYFQALCLCCALALLSGTPASAIWVLVDDFESYVTSEGFVNLNGQGSWAASGGSYRVRDQYDNPSNFSQNLRVSSHANNQWARLAGPQIAEGATATLFIRIQAPAGLNHAFGMTTVDTATTSGNFGPWMGFSGGEYGVGTSTAALTVAGTYEPDTWQNYWLVIDNAAKTTQLYSSTGLSDAMGAPVAGAFRNPSVGPLDRILFTLDGGAAGGIYAFFDDIYFSPGVLTTNPLTSSLSVEVDRITGNISLLNNTGSAITNIVGYSILAPSGTLNSSPAVWNSISGWTQLPPLGGTNLSESDLLNAPSPITLAAGSSLDFGNVWYKHFQEDVTFQLQLDDAGTEVTLTVPVNFVGGTGPWAQGDINFDGVLDPADVIKFAQYSHQPLAGTVPGATYAFGDMNGDLVSDYQDVLVYRTLYDSINGAGAFQLALVSVPEPSAMCLLALTIGGLAVVRRQRLDRVLTMLGVCITCTMGTLAQATVVFQENFDSIAVGETISITNSGFTTSATQLVPNNLAVIQDDTSNFFSPTPGNRYLHFVDGNTSADGNANPRIIAPANLSNATGFEFSFEFYEDGTVPVGFDEDIRIGLGDSAYGTNSRSVDFELLGTEFRPRGHGGHLVSYNEDTKYKVTAIGNYGSYPIVYNDGNDWVMPGQFDIWLNSTKVGDGLSMANGAPKTTHLGISGGSNAGVGSLFFDNIRVEDGVSSFSYQGEALLTLEVDAASGQVSIKNPYSQFPLDLDYYKISGAVGAVNLSGWNSLDAQQGVDPGHTGWIATAGSSSKVVEFTLDGSQQSVISGSPVSLGNLFNPASGAAGSLVFEYALDGGKIYQGTISILTSVTLFGDFNNDGIVNLADYTVWRDNLGAASDSVINNAGDGSPGVTADDYNIWKNNFGASANGSVVANGTVAVPEPSSTLLLLAAIGMGTLRLRSSKSRGTRLVL